MAVITVWFSDLESLELNAEVPCLAADVYNKACTLKSHECMVEYCAGKGRCGKCRAKISGNISVLSSQEKLLLSKDEQLAGIRLLCQTEILGDASIFVQKPFENMQIESDGSLNLVNDFEFYDGLGVAIDLGTTTIASLLFKAGSQVPLCSAVLPNPQKKFGADVLSRICASLNGHSAELFELAAGAVDQAIEELCRKAGCSCFEISRICICANTTMLYLLTQKNCSSISKAPFKADCLFGIELKAGNLNGSDGGLKTVKPETSVYLAPCVSAFIGADTVSCMLSLDVCQFEKPVMIADMGTNSEMVLYMPAQNGGKTKILCTSSAAGPAFEGADISCGMCAVSGAVEKIDIINGKAVCSVIGNVEPCGLCGSGLLDAAAVLRQAFQLDENGCFVVSQDEDSAENGVFELVQDKSEKTKAVLYKGKNSVVTLSQDDVRAFQLAKAALCAGLECLLVEAEKSADSIETVFLAGGFSKKMNVSNAVYVGLVPARFGSKIKNCGNAALMGAARLLQDKNAKTEALKLVQNACVIELGGSHLFQQLFIERMNLKAVKS